MGNIVRKLPIGIQSFDKLRTENYLYVVATKILQKSGIQKNEVIELIYRGFI